MAMDICEAMMARDITHPFLTRTVWENVVHEVGERPIYIQPTDTPDGCLYYGPATENPRSGWQPRAEDLLARDWKVTNGVGF